jgi:hypothetical protein
MTRQFQGDGRQFQGEAVQYEDTSGYLRIRQDTSAYNGRQFQGGEASRYEEVVSSLTSMRFSQE